MQESEFNLQWNRHRLNPTNHAYRMALSDLKNIYTHYMLVFKFCIKLVTQLLLKVLQCVQHFHPLCHGQFIIFLTGKGVSLKAMYKKKYIMKETKPS